MDPMDEIRQTFFQECEEQLVELESGLLAIEAGESDTETVNAVFRAVHSIKGGAGAFNLTDLVQFAHAFENTLDGLRVGKFSADPALIKIMLRAADLLTDLVRSSRDGSAADLPRSRALVGELAQAIAERTGGGAPAPAPTSAPAAEPEFTFQPTMVDLADFDDLGGPGGAYKEIILKPRADLYAKGNETAILMRELDRLGTMSVTCDVSELPVLDELDPEGAYFSWTVELRGCADPAAVTDIFDFVEWDSDLSIKDFTEGGEADFAPSADEPKPMDIEPTLSDKDLLVGERPADPPPAPKAPAPALAPAPAGPAPAPAPASAEAHPGGGKTAAAAASPTIRVELDRVDRLINLAGELVINQAMLSERAGEVGLSRRSAVSNGLEELEQLTRDIQDSVMAIRAQPVRSVFQRLPRLVREVAVQTGKSVRLVTEGEGTEVDKTVIEHLSDPLTHMVRNAIDHGLESSEKRLERGKTAEGTLKVSASHRSGRIIIEVSDDGAGINRVRVREIAENRGLIAKDAKLSDEDVDNLIFLPGFSTADKVSDISGRGVGMDVVKRSIQALGGRISITSKPGEGSTFTLSLPLTLAVLDGMVLSCAQQTFVVPLSAVVEILMPQDVAVHGFADEARLIGLRKGFISLIDVGRKLNIRRSVVEPKAGVVLLVETDGGERIGLVVDAIQGQRQVVIKSLETNYGRVPGIAAATILGDGRVALILDVDMMVANLEQLALPPSSSSQSKGESMESNHKSNDPRELVTFLIGTHEFCVDIMSVKEIRGWTAATPLPHTPSYVRGVINLRGAVLSIIDLADRLGLPAPEPTARHVIVVVQIGDQFTGLLVDAVTGILTVEAKAILPPPDVTPEAARSSVQGVLAIDDRMISLISLDDVLPMLDRRAA